MRRWLNDTHFRSLLKNTGYLAISKAIAAIAGIAVLAFSGRSLGLETFGILILVASYAQAANGLAKFQTWQLVVRFGGNALARSDSGTFKHAIGFGLGLDLLSGIAGMIAALALLPLLGGWFGIERGYLAAAAAYCLIIPVMAASTPVGVLRALDRFDLLSWQGTMKPILRAVLTGIAFLDGWGFSAFLFIWLGTELVSELALWLLCGREMKRRDLIAGTRPTLRPRELDRAWAFAIRVNLTYSLESAWGPIARLIVGGLLGPASAAAYRVAASLADSVKKPTDLLAKAYYPEVVRMDFATKHPWRLMLRGTALAGLIGLIALLVMGLAGRQLVDAIFGPGFESVYPVLLIMMLVPAIGILTFPLPSMLLALDRASAPLIARLVGTAAYFLLIYPLATWYGLSGAAWAFVIGNLLMAVTLIAQLRGEHSRWRGK